MTLSWLMNTMAIHLGQHLTPTSSVVSSSEQLTGDVDNSQLKDAKLVDPSMFKEILFLLYLLKHSCSFSSPKIII